MAGTAGNLACPRLLPAGWRTRSNSQALVEFALTLPMLFGVIVALFQLCILFVVYIALLHSTRDVTRWLVVHPDSTDAEVEAYIRANLPSVVAAANLDFSGLSSATSSDRPWDPTCPALDGNLRCSSRISGSKQEVALTYNAAPHIFLPTEWRFGFVTYRIPVGLPRYRYVAMIEPR